MCVEKTKKEKRSICLSFSFSFSFCGRDIFGGHWLCVEQQKLKPKFYSCGALEILGFDHCMHALGPVFAHLTKENFICLKFRFHH
jgi:hypothetical protein